MDFPTNNSRTQVSEAHKNVLFFGSLIAVGVVVWLMAYKTGLVAYLFAAVGL